MSCKDCTEENDSYRYLWLEGPESFNFKIDKRPFTQYILGTGNVYGQLPKQLYAYPKEAEIFKSDFMGYTGFSEIDYNNSPRITVNHQTVGQVINRFNELSLPSNYRILIASVPNKNIGNFLSGESPKFLTHNNFYNPVYEDMEEPTWLLSYDKCSVEKEKSVSYGGYKITGCGINTIEFRLKLRSLLFFNSPAREVKHIFGISPSDLYYGIKSKTAALKQYEYVKGLESHSGSKNFGLTPLRYEVGLYHHNNKEYEPIIFSSPNYPQAILDNINEPIWVKVRPDIIRQDSNLGLLDPIVGNPNVTTSIAANVNSSLFQYTTQNKYEYGYYYQGIIPDETTLKLGHMAIQEYTGNTNILTSKSIYISTKIADELVDDNSSGYDQETTTYKIKNFFKSLEGITNAEIGQLVLKLNIEYKSESCFDGELPTWTTLSSTEYGIDVWQIENDYVKLQLRSLAFKTVLTEYDPLDCEGNVITSIKSQTSNTDYYTLDTSYRYNIDVIGKINGGSYVGLFSKYDGSLDDRVNFGAGEGPVLVPNYTKLTEQFSSELTGFVQTNLDEGPVSLYLKLKPENGNYDDIVFTRYTANNIHSGNNSGYPNLSNSTIYNVDNIWGELGVDRRTNFMRPNVVYYEPLLPIKPEYTFVDTANRTEPHLFSNKWGRKATNTSSKEFVVMLEESWVRLKKIGEECCDDKTTDLKPKQLKDISSKQRYFV